MTPVQTGQRRGWGVWALAVLAIGTWGAWLLLPGEGPTEAPEVATHGQQGSAAPATTAPGYGVAVQPVLSAPAQAQVTPPPPHLGSTGAPVQTEWAIDDNCSGKARANAPAENAALADRSDVVRAFRQRASLGELLQRDADSQKQAAGSLLQAFDARGALCESNDCAEHEAAQARTVAAALQRLATTATNNTNATVYAWAYAGCRAAAPDSGRPAACLQITPARWAEISPRSGWAWLAVAAEGQATNNVSLIEAALQRITASNADWSSPAAAFQRTLVDAVASPKADQGQLDMTILLPTTTSVRSVFTGLIGSLPRYCLASMDANRHQVCAQLARQMLQSVGSIAEQQVALKVAAAVGLDKGELAPHLAEQERATKLLSTNFEEGLTLEAQCTRLKKTRELAFRMSQIGELAAVREALAPPSARDGAHRR